MIELVSSEDRPELHNPSIDEDVALVGGCGQVHLPTGDTCTLTNNHPGSCHFTERAEVPEHRPGALATTPPRNLES